VMTNDPAVHPLTALDLVIGASTAPKRRKRKRPIGSTLRAARKAGARRVELTEEKMVVDFSGEPAGPGGAGALDSNEWDEVLPGGRHGSN
jgi:hypothetical protein